MKSKEAIRNDIIHYASLTWGTKNIGNLNPLIHLMIEEISNELFLLDNKLEDTDAVVFDKLMKNLSPSVYDYVRPSHLMLQVNLSVPSYIMDRQNEFYIKDVSQKLKKKGVSVVSYTPLIDSKLHDISIVHLFQNKTLYQVDKAGKRTFMRQAKQRAEYATVWFAVDTNVALNNLKDLSFYIDFPHLKDDHPYFELLKETHWTFNGEPLAMKPGLPMLQNTPPTRLEQEILNYYQDHFLTIADLDIKKAAQHKFPQKLMSIIDPEDITSLSPLYWFSISFPSNFAEEDIEKMILAVNVFPAINRYYNTVTIAEEEFADTASLPSASRQEFLMMAEVVDSKGNVYEPFNVINGEGTYTIRPVQRKSIDDPLISDYLERLVDTIHDERTAFPGIENDKIIEVLNAVQSIQNSDTYKSEMNRLREYSETGLVTLAPCEDAKSIKISYWTTHADLLNDMVEKTGLMAGKVPELVKVDATFFTHPSGGRNFYGLESLKAINRYYLTSRDRILTKNDIINFCKIELGEYIEHIDVVRKAVVTNRVKKGITAIFEIQLTPSVKHYKKLKQKGFMKELLLRLKHKSPDHYSYEIKMGR